MENNAPLVSVCMITYNHEKFIAQAIEGVLMQKNNFQIELVLGEDYSTDETRKICEAYAQKHREIIKLLPSERNLGMMPNFVRTLKACTGKYIALCEGDDYWTDPFKLQKQVSFLEANPDFSICFHWVKVLWENEAILKESVYEGPSTFSLIDYVEKKKHNISTSTLSVCYKVLSTQQMRLYYSWVMDLPNGDYTLCALVLATGKAYVMPEYMGVYRKHQGGVSNNFQSDSWVKSRLGTFKMLLRSKQLDLKTKYYLVKRIYQIYSWTNVYVRYLTKAGHFFTFRNKLIKK